MALVGAIGSLLLMGASCGQTSASPPRTAAFPTLESFKPNTISAKNADLILGGTRIAVTIEPVTAGNRFDIRLLSHGQETEVESYVFDAKSFSLKEVAGERYEPPLNLLRFPLSPGDSYTWSGELIAGEMPRDAKAEITTMSEKLFLADKDWEAIRVNVKLYISSGSPMPAERSLSFWFVPKQGILKREFGAGSSRVPPEPD